MFDRITEKIILDVLSCDYHFLLKKDLVTIKNIERDWLRKLYNLNVTIPSGRKIEFLFLRSLVRDDYRNLFESVYNECNSDSKIMIADFLLPDRTNVEAIKFLQNNLCYLNAFSFYPESLRLALFIKFNFYLYIVDKIFSNFFDCLVCFADMQPIDALASHIGNMHNIKTVTIQHGLYVEYLDMDTVNVVNYEVQPSKYFLAWGQNTKDLIGKYHPETEVILCGKPNIEVIDPSPTASGILIIFDQEIFRESNIQLLKLINEFASQFGYNFEVRFHPHNNQASYRKLVSLDEQVKDFGDYEFIVGISSSLIYELKVQGLKVFQFKCKVPTVEFPTELIFDSVEGLHKLSKNKLNCSFDPILCIGEESKLNYCRFFENVLSVEQEKQPFFSIIIPTFNSAHVVHKALSSIESQEFTDFEVVISDGGSDDYTYEYLITRYENDDRFKIYSAKDNGIYDGMNKGFKAVTGKWLIFLGSDDEFYDNKVLAKVHKHISSFSSKDYGMVYGNVVVSGDVKWAKSGTVYDGQFDIKKIKQKNICHQAIFYNVDLKRKVMPYNDKYKLCADWDMNLKVFSKFKTSYISENIAYFNAGGASTEGADPEFGKDFKNNIRVYFSE